MKKVIVSIFFALILVNPASAVVYGSNGAINVINEGKINSTTLESKLSEWLIKNPSYGTIEEYINQTSRNVWVYRQRVECGNNSTLVFDSADDCSELRLGSTIGSMGGHVEFGTRLSDRNGDSYGGMVFRNVTVIGWNETTDSMINNYTDMTKIETYNVVLDNVSFKAIKIVNCYNTVNGNKDYVTNITINDSEWGLLNTNISNTNFSNIECNNISFTGFAFSNCTNCKLDRYNFWNNESFRDVHATSSNALSVGNGYHNYILNMSADSPRWGGIYFSGSEHDTIVDNVTINYAGHNGIDVHGGCNLTIQNITVNESYSNDFIVSSSNAYDIIFRNISSYSPSASGVSIADNASNVTIYNLSVGSETENPHDGIKMMGCSNITVIGLNDILTTTTWKPTTYGNLTTQDIVLIDASLYNSSYKDIWVQKSIGAKLLNVRCGKSSYDSNTDYYNAYYLDMVTKYENETYAPNAKLKISSNISSYQSQDGYARNKTIFYADSKGCTYPPNINRSNSPAIVEYHKNLDGTRDYLSHTVSIDFPNNRTVSLSGITPDSSWYREDPNIPNYTITAIIPNTSSTGPQIIGFAPAEDNPFNPGETKNFRVWTNESLTCMKWRVNGCSVLKGALNYTWNVTDKNTTIEFIGSNANGTVNKTWYLGGSSNEPSVPGGNPAQEIVFSPADSVLTKNVSETVDFSVSPDVFTTKEWYVDGDLVLNNTVSMSKRWSTAGTYNITFSGSGSEDVLHTWTVKVVEEPKEQNKSIITIAPEYQIIEPKKSFDLSIKIEPGTPISGTQLDFVFNSSKTSVNNVTEGDLLKQNGAHTIFSSGTTNNSAGTVKNIYGFILGTSNVSTPGTMATVNLTAGNNTGMAKFSLTNIIISDANSKSVPYTVTNATVLIDTAPVITPIGSKSVNEKSTLAFKVSAKDADGDRLILSASGVPQDAVFNTTSGNFTWTPERGQAGIYTITFKVSDSYLTDSQNVTVTVNKLNNPPVISSFEPLNGSSFSEGERIGISVNASDAEGQALNYSIRIDGVEYSTGKEYVWETDYSSSGNHTIEVAVSDGIDEAKAQRTVFINECHPRWDVNEDGVVNILDITMVSQTYGTTVNKPYPRHDVNQDGNINILDLTLVGNHFGEYVK